jgi:hypothetical protein
MKKEQTDRGFDLIKFKDLYGKECELQKSSLAEFDAIWLGIGMYSMHLSKKHVRKLLPHLIKFLLTGEI